MNSEDVIRTLRQLKSESRARRQQGDLVGEISCLQMSVERGRAALAEKPSVPAEGTGCPLVWEVADCVGMMGGALLRQGKVREAIEMYQEGRDLEMSRADAVNLTYNTVNLFAARLLAGGWRTLDDSRTDLATVVARLRARSESSEADDVWIWADLGMSQFLSGVLNDAQSSYEKAAALASPGERSSILGRLLMIEERRLPLSPEQTAFLNTVKQILA